MGEDVFLFFFVFHVYSYFFFWHLIFLSHRIDSNQEYGTIYTLVIVVMTFISETYSRALPHLNLSGSLISQRKSKDRHVPAFLNQRD